MIDLPLDSLPIGTPVRQLEKRRIQPRRIPVEPMGKVGRGSSKAGNDFRE
jgi:hypothetical protein